MKLSFKIERKIMTKEEFEAVAKTTVTDREYEVIEFVYARHPSIRPVEGKKDIAAIYNFHGGMCIIRDMVETSKNFELLQAKFLSLQNQIESVCREMEAIRRGEKLEQ